MRTSSADGRDRYYAIDLARCGALLQDTARALHPALALATPPARDLAAAHRRRARVLFLCTGNSARSQMAEALAETMSAGRVRAASAGSNPKALHPHAVHVMRRRGIDISGNRTKHLDELAAQRFDVVVTLCDRVREVCPEFPSHPRLVHWSIADPAAVEPNRRVTPRAFERTAAELETRLGFFLTALPAPSTGRSSHAGS
jgi:protein-tyrosine-phosphatase